MRVFVFVHKLVLSPQSYWKSSGYCPAYVHPAKMERTVERTEPSSVFVSELVEPSWQEGPEGRGLNEENKRGQRKTRKVLNSGELHLSVQLCAAERVSLIKTPSRLLKCNDFTPVCGCKKNKCLSLPTPDLQPLSFYSWEDKELFVHWGKSQDSHASDARKWVIPAEDRLPQIRGAQLRSRLWRRSPELCGGTTRKMENGQSESVEKTEEKLQGKTAVERGFVYILSFLLCKNEGSFHFMIFKASLFQNKRAQTLLTNIT